MATDEQVSDIATRIFDSVGRPIRGASLFYALYYLTEVEGVEQAAFDFAQIRDEYHEAFWWYGVYSIAKEVSNVYDKYFVDGFKTVKYLNRHEAVIIETPRQWVRYNVGLLGEDEIVPDVIQPPRVGEMPPEPGTAQITLDPNTVSKHASGIAEGITDERVRDLVTDIFIESGQLQRIVIRRRFDDIRRFLHALEEQFDAVSQPEPFIAATGAIFEHTVPVGRAIGDRRHEIPDVEVPEPVLSENAETVLLRASGWVSRDWNGEGWAGIPRYLLQRDETPKTSWTDMGFAIEHNNQAWFDKVDIGDEDRRVVAEVGGLGGDMAPQVRVLGALQTLLDAGREGDMETVFDFATHYDHEVEGLSLSRWKTRLGL